MAIGDEILTQHPSAAAVSDLWQSCRDFAAGARAVRAAGARYVPKLKGQREEDYAAYIKRGRFFNGFQRTVRALTGTAFARQPLIEAGTRLATHLHDVTLAGEPFGSFAKRVVSEVLTVGRGGCLVDYAKSVARPYWVYYRAEDILNWDTVSRGGDTILTFLVLRETEWVRDGFKVKPVTKVRVCELVGEGQARHYVVTVYTKRTVEGRDEWVPDAPVEPARRGAQLDFIPFVFFGSLDVRADVDPPPLADLLEVNVSHWRSSVDLKHGEHFTALPTPVVTGQQIDELSIGSGDACVLPNPEAKAYYLEFTGSGLETIRRSLSDDERLMAILGSRMLEAQKAAAEAASTVRMRHAGDDATLASIVGAVSAGITQAMQWHSWWDGESQTPNAEDVKASLNTEFTTADLPIDAISLLAQAEKISYATLYYNLERAGLTRPNVSAEQEREQILAEGGLDPMARETQSARSGQEPADDEDDDEEDA